MAPTMGIEKARGESVDSRRGAECCDTHPSRGRDGEWAKERKPRRKTDRRPGSLCSWDSAKTGGVGTVQWIGRVAENTTNLMLDNGVTIKAL